MTQGPNYSANVGLNINPFLQATQQMLNAWNQAQVGMRKRTTQHAAVNKAFTAGLTQQIKSQVAYQHQSQILSQQHHNRMAQIQQQHLNRIRQMQMRAAQAANNFAARGKTVQGALMPTRSREHAQAFLKLSSAAQGAMIATSALQGNITGLLFGLIFLSWAETKVAVTTIALTVALGTLMKITKGLIGMATTVGKEWEEAGVRMAHGLNSAAKSVAVLQRSANFSMRFGLDPKQTQESVYALEKLGMASDTYLKGLANAASGTGKDLADVTKSFVEITKASAEEREALVEKFAKDMEIEVKNYASSLDLVMALQNRWNGTIEDMADTQAGILGRIRGTWYQFAVAVGIVLNDYIKPVLRGILAFVDGLRRGFVAAMEESIATGEMAENAANFSAIIAVLIPRLASFGYLIGKVVFKAIQVTAQIIKVLSDTLIRLWNKIKPVIDTIRTWIPLAKQLIDKLISWYLRNKDLIDGLALAWLMLRLFNTAVGLGPGLLQAMALGVLGLTKAILGVPFRTVQIGISGIAAAIAAIQALIGWINAIPGKLSDVIVNALLHLPLTSMIQAFDALKNSIGEAMRQIIQGLNDAIAKMNEFATKGEESAGRFGTGFLNKLSGYGPAIANAIALLLTNPAVLAAASNPYVIGAIAVAVVAGLAIAFPFQTGQITAIIGNVLTAAILGLPIILTRLAIMTATFLILVFTQAMELAVNVITTLVGNILTVVINTIRSVFTDIGQMISAIIRGDWDRAAREALSIILTLFVRFPLDIAQALISGLATILTVHIPAFGRGLISSFQVAFAPVIGFIVGVFQEIRAWVGSWFGEFAKGVADIGFKPAINFLKGQLDGLLNDVKRFFRLTGLDSIGGIIANFWGEIKNAISNLPNPFSKFGEWIDWSIGKIRDLIGAYNSIPLLPNIGLPGGGSGGTQPAPPPPTVAQKIGAYIISQQSVAGGQWIYKVQPSYWSNQPAPAVISVGPQFNPPNMANYVFGGRVPGVTGEKQLVMAEGGEMFGGHPTFERGRNRGGGDMGGVTVYNDLRGSVITNDLVEKLAESTAKVINQRMFGNRKMMLHRLGG